MVYNYTKPRGPIAAMYSSPGPCYALPSLVGQPQHDPRSTKARRPAWHFGTRHGKFTNDCSPGPIYFPESNMSRSGADGTPHYTIYPRLKDGTMFTTPAPCTYSLDSSLPMVKKKNPSFVFGTRFKGFSLAEIPAANKYSLDPMLGRTIRGDKKASPAYTLGGKNTMGGFDEDLMKTPGPGTYQVTIPSTYKLKCPEYSITARNELPGDNTVKPGPSAYSPGYKNYGKSAPQFGFGIRHSQYKGEFITAEDAAN